jgi:hypothetical protein
MLPQGPIGPAPVRQLLPVVAQTRRDRWALFARLDQASGLIDRCWFVGPGVSMEDVTLRLEPSRLHFELPLEISPGRPLLKLDPASVLLLQELVPAIRGPKLHVFARALADRGSLVGVLLVADSARWLRGGATTDAPLIDSLAELFETELARDVLQQATTSDMHRRLVEREAELERVTERLRTSALDLKVANRTTSADQPRLLALEAAITRGTELLVSAHTDLERSDRQLRKFQSVFGGLRNVLERHASGAPPRELAGELVKSVADAFHGSRCSLLLCDLDPRGKDCLRMAASLGLPDGVDADRVRVRLGEGISGWVAINGTELVVRDSEDAVSLPLVNDEAYTGPAFASFPLFCHGRFAGVLNLTNFMEGTFDDSELEALRLVALTVALVVDHARLNERMFAFDPA